MNKRKEKRLRFIRGSRPYQMTSSSSRTGRKNTKTSVKIAISSLLLKSERHWSRNNGKKWKHSSRLTQTDSRWSSRRENLSSAEYMHGLKQGTLPLVSTTSSWLHSQTASIILMWSKMSSTLSTRSCTPRSSPMNLSTLKMISRERICLCSIRLEVSQIRLHSTTRLC